jgi:hypothetical protein
MLFCLEQYYFYNEDVLKRYYNYTSPNTPRKIILCSFIVGRSLRIYISEQKLERKIENSNLHKDSCFYLQK